MSATTAAHPAAGVMRPLSRFTVAARACYLLCALGFAGCVVAQVFFAGLGVLVNPAYWAWHIAFANNIFWAALVLVGVGIAARLPRRMLVLSLLTLPLFVLQYILIFVPGKAGVLALRALHPVNAMVIFAIALALISGAWRLLRAPQEATPPVAHREPVIQTIMLPPRFR